MKLELFRSQGHQLNIPYLVYDVYEVKVFSLSMHKTLCTRDNHSDTFYYRMTFPKKYKGGLEITKFEKNYRRRLDYQFINAFPKSITSIPVSYGSAEVLKVTVSFNYDRYIMDVGRINN